VADLLQLLTLEQLEADLFRGESRDFGARRVFGGQVMGQALAAAYATIEGREAHSLHAYFLRAGDPDLPIDYRVERSRDGKSFAARRVVAVQNNEQIFHLSASFQIAETTGDRQGAMPAVPEPESLPDVHAVIEELQRRAPDRPLLLGARRHAFEFRPAELPDVSEDVPCEPHLKLWFRLIDRVPDDPILHRCLLAYASDHYLLTAASMDVRMATPRHEDLQLASIDHAMWFHRPARADEWLLYVVDSPTASAGRGFARGSIFSQKGRLVASTAQEVLVRKKALGG
jgi:acyl-CoA thioesterase II